MREYITVGYMMRKNQLADPPDALKGRNIDVKYSSMIARSQRISEVQNILRTVEVLQPFAAADPSLLDNLDGDKILNEVTSLLGFPKSALRSEREVEQIRKARAEAQQAEVQAQNASRQADVMSKMAQAQSQSQQGSVA